MALSRENLVNAALFMDRATTTGKEALAWVQTYQAISDEIKAIDKAAALAGKNGAGA